MSRAVFETFESSDATNLKLKVNASAILFMKPALQLNVGGVSVRSSNLFCLLAGASREPFESLRSAPFVSNGRQKKS
jgi:hypothetical protein